MTSWRHSCACFCPDCMKQNPGGWRSDPMSMSGPWRGLGLVCQRTPELQESPMAPCSPQRWAGSQWALVTDRREHKNVLADLLPASSSSMTSAVSDELGMHTLAGLHRPVYQSYSACCHKPLLDHTPVHWALGAFWYMAFQPHLAGVCQWLLDNEDIDAIDRPSRPPQIWLQSRTSGTSCIVASTAVTLSQTVQAQVIPQESIDYAIKSMSGWYESSPQCANDLHFQWLFLHLFVLNLCDRIICSLMSITSEKLEIVDNVY